MQNSPAAVVVVVAVAVAVAGCIEAKIPHYQNVVIRS